jgi:hypothetical protein
MISNKLIVRTTGSFSLVTDDGQYLDKKRGHVHANTAFIQQRLGSGELRILATVPDEATDAEFETYWRESNGDEALAVASFLSKFAPSEKPAHGEKPPKGTARPAVSKD